MVYINEQITIPDDELSFSTSRSSGPGGQNVNKVSTRVTLLFDVARSPSLDERERGLLMTLLPGRINKKGILTVASQRHRTQLANREAALARFAELLRYALAEIPERHPTNVPAGVHARRLRDKRLRGRLKRERGQDLADDE